MPNFDFNKQLDSISNFIEITLQHGCSSVNLLDILSTPLNISRHEIADLTLTME